MNGNESYGLTIREDTVANTADTCIDNIRIRDGRIAFIGTSGMPGGLALELDPERNFGTDLDL